MTNLAQHLSDTAEHHPDQAAIILDDHRLSYREVDEAAQRLAAWLLEQEVQPGDQIGRAHV